jgi:DNA-directed RNA polymerase subunit RPC12/RpoP
MPSSSKFEDNANLFIHARRLTCPVCGAAFKLLTILQTTSYRCSCGTRIAVVPGMRRQRIVTVWMVL